MSNELMMSAVLQCGTYDLSILNGVEYDWDDVVERAKVYNEINLRTLFFAVIDIGLNNLEAEIENRHQVLLDKEECGYIDGDEMNELEALSQLNVHDDIDVWFNFIDTHVTINNNTELYLEHFLKELNDFEANTGFSLT